MIVTAYTQISNYYIHIIYGVMCMSCLGVKLSAQVHTCPVVNMTMGQVNVIN